MNCEAIIDDILARERGYVDNPADRGGPTNYGVTQAVARANGYAGDMKDLPLSIARAIYRNRYIVEPQFDKIAAISESVANELIDIGVNMGPTVAATFLQRWLNGLNARGSRYADAFVDGRIGPATIAAFAAYARWRGAAGERVMVFALACTRGARYLEIAEHNATQEDFLYGWINSRIVGILQGA